MSLPSSSTSSSDLPSRRKAWKVFYWSLICLIFLDVLVGVAFPYPKNPRELNPGKLALFFDYGRSMEGRLKRATRVNRNETAPITLSGWYDPLEVVERPVKANGEVITVYGMSHAVLLADAVQAESNKYSVRSVGAPGATTNWAYGAFRRDVGRKKGKAVVLAIMSTTLPMITTMGPVTWNTSFAMPYTADRYSVGPDGALHVTKPPFESFEAYVRAFSSPEKWATVRAAFAKNDTFYDAFLVEDTVLDNSTVVRLLRRAYAQKREHETRKAVLRDGRIDFESEAIRVANAIIRQFAADARREGLLPVIYVINNLGYQDQMFQAVSSTLYKNRIPFLNSAQFVAPDNPHNYLPDSHFTPENDKRLARELARIIDTGDPAAQSATPSN
ncbi:hypothetical protein [Aquisediminimonas profunda]|uniref:hypothetical protein n=1 Tax=Aquisediminimonas profunda TaxID=1550733 RepID=UPI001C629084|nr:hypothetical protein [Aquisediminimonas profunda]